MRRIFLCCAVFMLAFAATSGGEEATAPKHVIAKPADLKWGDPPPVFEKGASFTVVSGNPGIAGPYVVRLKMPAGYKINPHWHPTDENVTVISGTFAVGMGEKFDKATMTEVPAGGFVLLPAEMRHYAMAKTAAIVQVHGMGPFQLTYVNPADDPSTRTTTAK
jgi:quercetin dioxygenase-like cupin family protein